MSSGVRSWHAPTTIGAGSFPDVGVDAAGNAVLVWHATPDATHTTVSAAICPAGGGCGAPQVLGTTTATRSYAAVPTVAVNASGLAEAAWLSIVAPALTVSLRRYDPATGWAAAIEQTAMANQQYGYVGPVAAVALADTGEALAVWSRRDVNPQSSYSANQWAAVSTATGAFAEPTAIHTSTAPAAGNALVAITPDGASAVAVWNGSSTLFAAQWSRAAGWQPVLQLDDAANTGASGNAPAVAIAANGDAVVAWTSANAQAKTVGIRVRTLTANVWSAIIHAGDAQSGQGGNPSVFVDTTGTTLTWVTVSYSTQARGVWSQRRPTGGDWQAPVRLDDASMAAERTTDCRLAGDGKGAVMAMWLQDLNLTYVRYDPATGWSPAAFVGDVAVADSSAYSWPYALTMDRAGNAFAAWGAPTATGPQLRYSTFR